MMEISRSSHHVLADGVSLEGDLSVPEGSSSVVVFAHGSGSSRMSRRNRFVADVIVRAGMATFLFDLLTKEEDVIYENRFDIPLLARRLKSVTGWLRRRPETEHLPIGYFGASTGAAAAIIAAAELGDTIGAVVSRGGRPDLAERALRKVTAPVLLIVGGRDEAVIELNRSACSMITATRELKVVPGATHLFEEPGALEEVARLAVEWFRRHLAGRHQKR